MSMTAFDIEQFNGAAQVFWDTAFHAGKRAGFEEAMNESGRRHTQSLLELAAMYLEDALHASEEDFLGDVIRIRRILGCTPMMVPQVTRAIERLGRGIKEVDRDNVRAALAIVKEGLQVLS